MQILSELVVTTHSYTCTRVWWITPSFSLTRTFLQGRKVVNLYLIHVLQNYLGTLISQKLTNWRNNCLKFYFMKFSGNFNQKEDNLTYHSNVIIFLLFYLQPSRLKASPVLMISFFYSELQNSIISGFCSNQHFIFLVQLSWTSYLFLEMSSGQI